MAHEIKNPLTPIRLTLDRIEERAGAGQDIPAWFMAKSLSRINAQLDALERLVNQFHSFAREPEAHLRAVALGPAVRATAEGMAQQLCTKIEGDADIQADPHLLAQVLLNIWKNALEAKATEIRATVVHAAQGIELIVADNGPGIPESQIERVWLPYVSTKQGGTGLGLPIVKRLVETMGGRAMLRSRTGSVHHGVTVTLAFALAEEGDCAHDRADANLGCR
jgi:two-component system nitrogen regulation sensor histidine kinase NtrY